MSDDTIVWYFYLVLSLLWGAVSGSFSTMLAYRLPRNLPLWGKFRKKKDYSYSACPECGHRLHWFDLIPLLSWLFSQGRCRYCKAAVSRRYPIIEICSVILSATFYFAEGVGPALVPLMLSVPIFISLIVIDWDFRILPDSLNLTAFILGILYLVIGDYRVSDGLVAAAVYALTAFVVRYAVSCVLKKEALGWGDVKFFAVAGIWTGLSLLPQFLVLAGTIGVVFGTVYKKLTKTEAFPFGPCLIISMIICLVFGELIFL